MHTKHCYEMLNLINNNFLSWELSFTDEEMWAIFCLIPHNYFEKKSLPKMLINFAICNLSISSILTYFRDFIAAHPDIHFIGLSLTKACEFSMFKDFNNPDYSGSLMVCIWQMFCLWKLISNVTSKLNSYFVESLILLFYFSFSQCLITSACFVNWSNYWLMTILYGNRAITSVNNYYL